MTSSTEHVLDMVTQRLHNEPDCVLPTLRLLIDAEALVQVGDDRTSRVLGRQLGGGGTGLCSARS